MASDLVYHRLKYSSLLWVLLGFCIFAVIGFYSARMTNDYPGYDAGRGKDRIATREKVDKAEDAMLHPVDDKGNPTATWADQDKGLIMIPIDQAMTDELSDLKSVTVGEGLAIPGTPAAAPAKPAPAPAPETNAAPAAATPPASTNAAPVTPAKTKPKTKKQKPPVLPTGPTPPTTSILTPGEINQPVFNLRNIKSGPQTNFQGFITYGSPVFNTHPVAKTVVIHEGSNIVLVGTLISSTNP